MNRTERAKMVLAMETIIRHLNDEEFLYDGWLAYGVADGDITDETTPDSEVLNDYLEDDTFNDLMHYFGQLMRLALKDGYSHAFYCDKICNKSRGEQV